MSMRSFIYSQQVSTMPSAALNWGGDTSIPEMASPRCLPGQAWDVSSWITFDEFMRGMIPSGNLLHSY